MSKEARRRWEGRDQISKSVDFNIDGTDTDDVTITSVYANNTGQLVSQQQQIGAAGEIRTIDFDFDDAGRIERINYPSLNYVDYSFNERSLIETISCNGNLIGTFGYDSFNRINQKDLSFGSNEIVSLGITYNDYSEPVEFKWAQNGGLDELLRYEYDYDSVGKRLNKFKAHNPDMSDLYIYDSVNRLTDFKRGTLSEPDRDSIVGTPARQEEWTLDELYNWMQWKLDGNTESRTHNQVNEITSIDTQQPEYDGLGNLTEVTVNGTVYRFEFDIFNRLVKVRDGQDTILAEYIYDASDRRIAKIIHEGETQTKVEYVLSEKGQVIEQYVDGALDRFFVFGIYVDEPLMMQTNTNDKYFYCTDAQYSVTCLLDEYGDIVERYDYTPYGTMEVYTDAGTDSLWFTADDEYNENNEIGNLFRFTGQQYDKETGLSYFRTRYFSPYLGRFLSRDTAGFNDGYNLYAAYFILNMTDPSGQGWWADLRKNVSQFVKGFFNDIIITPIGISGGLKKTINGLLFDEDDWWYKNSKEFIEWRQERLAIFKKYLQEKPWVLDIISISLLFTADPAFNAFVSAALGTYARGGRPGEVWGAASLGAIMVGVLQVPFKGSQEIARGMEWPLLFVSSKALELLHQRSAVKRSIEKVGPPETIEWDLFDWLKDAVF